MNTMLNLNSTTQYLTNHSDSLFLNTLWETASYIPNYVISGLSDNISASIKEPYKSTKSDFQNRPINTGYTHSDISGTRSTIGIVKCNDSHCVSNRLWIIVKDKFKEYGLLYIDKNDTERCANPYTTISYTNIRKTLIKKGINVKSSEGYKQIIKTQKSLNNLMKRTQLFYKWKKDSGRIGYCNEEASDKSPLGSASLVCPYCGSLDILIEGTAKYIDIFDDEDPNTYCVADYHDFKDEEGNQDTNSTNNGFDTIISWKDSDIWQRHLERERECREYKYRLLSEMGMYKNGSTYETISEDEYEDLADVLGI